MVQRSAAAGHRTIVSAGYYLDHGLPAARYYAVDPYDSRAMGVPPEVLERLKGTPLEPFVSDAMVAADAPELTDQDRALIAGGETPLWTELVPESGMEMHMWPRAAAIAERLWSPSAVRDTASMYRRLESVSTDLELQGLQHRWASMLALQRLAAGHAAHPLTVLAGAVEPLQYLGRLAPMLQAMMAGKTSGDDLPPNRLADAVPPESEVA